MQLRGAWRAKPSKYLSFHPSWVEKKVFGKTAAPALLLKRQLR